MKFDEFRPGQVLRFGTATLSEADILAFAREYDPQWFHVDVERARNGRWQGLIASGWHTGALVMRLVVDANPLGDLPLLGLGVDGIEWPQPVRPGDTLRVEMEVVAIRPSNSTRTHGIVKLKTTARNQHGEVVYIVTPNCWVPRRPT